MKKLKLNEIVDGKVEFVSLVKAGANRIPFRIYKSEDKHMIDLDAFELFKAEKVEAKPSIAAVVVNKDSNLDLVKARIEKAGLSIEQMDEQEKGIVFKQKDAEGQVALLKIDNDIVLQIDNVSKSFKSMNFETESFAELFSQAGAIPTLKTGLDVLQETILNILYKAADSAKAAESVKKSIDEFSSMAFTLVNGIPQVAFKMEDPEILEALQKEHAPKEEEKLEKQEEQSEDEVEAEEAEDEDSEEGVEDDESDDEEEEVSKMDDMEDEEKTYSDKKKKMKKTKGKKMKKSEDATNMVKQLTDVIKKEFDSRFSEIQKTVDEMNERVGKTEQLVKSTDEALNGIVIHDNAQDRVSKSANGMASDSFVHFDTAYGEPN